MKTQEEWTVLCPAGVPSTRYRVAEARTPPDPRDPQRQARLGTQASPVRGEQPAPLRGSEGGCSVRKGACRRGRRSKGTASRHVVTCGKAPSPRHRETLPSSRGAFPQVSAAISGHLLVSSADSVVLLMVVLRQVPSRRPLEGISQRTLHVFPSM